MLDASFFASRYGNADVKIFRGQMQASLGQNWQAWNKPRGKTLAHITLIGKGGDGGLGVIGANSSAAGGGSGAAGGQTTLIVPLWALPDVLYLSLPGVGSSQVTSMIAIARSTAANDIIAIASPGSNGGNAAGANAGSAGTAGAAATAGSMPLGWPWLVAAVAGQNGVAGGTTGSPSNLLIPSGGCLVTAGTAGAGLGAAGVAGSNGGQITGAGNFPTIAGGLGATSTTTPPGDWRMVVCPITGLFFFTGGLGGGSTHGSATGAGLVQGSGGDGQPGCGGGGQPGALTGSTPGRRGLGGEAMAIIVCT